MTATLLENGDPLPNAIINFEVSGAHTESDTATTDAAGQATFTYLGTNTGSDVITACYDADDDGTCEAVASAKKHWGNVNEAPSVACVPTTNPAGKNIPGSKASPKAGMNPDGFYQLVALDEDSPAPSVYVGDTASNFVAGPYTPGTKVKITQANGTAPRAKTGPGEIGFHVMLNGDAKVYAMDDEGATSTIVYCYVPRPPK